MAALYPNIGAMTIAGIQRTALASAVLHLYTAVANPLGSSTVLADFTEADYDGYVAKTVTAWLAAYLDPEGGASFQSGTQQFDFGPAATPSVPNTVLGFYVVSATGKLIFCANFADPVPMAVVGDSIPLNVVLNFGRA